MKSDDLQGRSMLYEQISRGEFPWVMNRFGGEEPSSSRSVLECPGTEVRINWLGSVSFFKPSYRWGYIGVK